MTDNAFVWSYITLTAVLLTLCLDWGLPSERNRDLLLFNQDFDEKQIALLDDLRVSLRAANALAREKNLREQVVSVRGRENTEPLLSYSDKLEEFWSFMTNSANADERKPYTALSAMNPATLDFNPRLFIYGGAFLYPLGGALYLSSALGLISVDRSTEATVADPDNIAAIYVVGRSMSMVAFLVTLALTHRLGKRLGGAPAGVFAMVLFSISHVALNQSVVTKPHVYAACFSLLSVLCALKYLDGSSRRHLVLSSVFCGVAIGSFLPLVNAARLILLVNACLLFNAGDGHKSLKTLGVLFAGSFVVVILTNPYCVLDLDRFIHTVRIHGSSEGWGYTAISLRKLLAYAVDMMFSYGFLLSVLVPYGMVLASKTRVEPFRRLALSTFVVFLLAGTTLGNSRPVHLRIDSSGLSVPVGQWRTPPKARDYRKLHLAVDEQTSDVVAGELTSKRAHCVSWSTPVPFRRVWGAAAHLTSSWESGDGPRGLACAGTAGRVLPSLTVGEYGLSYNPAYTYRLF